MGRYFGIKGRRGSIRIIVNKRPESGGKPHNPIKSTCYNESLASGMSERL
jgi:hypothetical protein